MITYILIAVNVLVWAGFNLYAFLNGQVAVDLQATMGGQIDYLVLQGEVWRVFTAMFLHVDIKHLAMNMYALFIMGQLVERNYGKLRFLLIYFVAGILGNVVSFAFLSGSSMGASGAIFGLVGASIIIALDSENEYRKRLLFNAAFIVIASAGIGISVNINQFAHFGGLIGGILLTSILVKHYSNKMHLHKNISILILLIIFFGAIYLGMNNPANNAQKLLASLEVQYQQKNMAQVELIGEEILAIDAEIKDEKKQALWYVADAENQLKKYQESLAHANEMKAYSFADGYYLEAFPYWNLGKLKEAKNSLLMAKQNGSTQTDIDELLKQIS